MYSRTIFKFDQDLIRCQGAGGITEKKKLVKWLILDSKQEYYNEKVNQEAKKTKIITYFGIESSRSSKQEANGLSY